MRRIAALTVSLAASLAIAATPATGPTTVATDHCGVANLDSVGESVVLPWHDLCSLSIETITDADDDVTELEVRLEMLTLDRPTPTIVTTRWDVGDCVMRLIHGDASPRRDAISAFSMMCEGDEPAAEHDCVVLVEDVLDDIGVYCVAARSTIDIPSPTVDGTTLVWRLRFEGDLAIAESLHEHGDELTIQASVASPRIWETSATVTQIICASDDCIGVVNDEMTPKAGTIYTIG